jgi:hypothetical protein
VGGKRGKSPPRDLTASDQEKIAGILGRAGIGFGTRAGLLLRQFPNLGFSRNAKLLYLLLAGFIGADGERTGEISVSLKKLAQWLECSTRSTQAAIRELCRTGPFPLLTQNPGRPGRVGKYGWVSNPFELARRQAAQAEVTRAQRRAQATREKNAIFVDRFVNGSIDEETARAKLAAVEQRTKWNLPARPLIRWP